MFAKFNKDFGWQISSKAEDMDKNPIKDGNGKDVYVNMKILFKKGCEPTQEDLNQYNSFQFDLQAVEKNGHIRKAYLLPNAYVNKKGILVTEYRLYLDDWTFAKPDGSQEMPIDPEPSKDDNPVKVEIKPEELPFY